MTRICLDCGEEFEAINLGPVTRRYCRECTQKQIDTEEKRQREAQAGIEEARQRDLVRLAQMPAKWRDVRFDNSDTNLNPAGFKVAKGYAERFSSRSPSLVFYSAGYGTGKTHLAACIANHVLHEKRAPVLFKKARDLMLELRRTFADGADMTEADVLNKVLSASLLVLDDVGVDRRTDWLVSTYWTVFDRRLEWQLPVVITTNKPFEADRGEEVLDDRIGGGAVSRLTELCQGNVIDMSGPDLR